jgi:hypothetical protein
VQSIWLIRDTLIGEENGRSTFEFSSDIGLAFELETIWIAITKASHGSDTIAIEIASHRDELVLMPLEARWENTLDRQYQYSREWIVLAGLENAPGVDHPKPM